MSRDRHRQVVHARVRTRVEGTSERPRLCVYRSLSHIYAQVVDDRSGRTLVSASSLDKDTKKRSEEHTSELQSPDHLVCRLLLEKKNRPPSTTTSSRTPALPPWTGPGDRDRPSRPRA